MFVVALRQNTKDLLVLFNHCLFPSGNGTKSVWTSSPDFPKTQKGNDAIFIVIDRLSKVAHFLPVRESITASQLADLYVSRIVSLHGVPLEINSDRGSLFTSRLKVFKMLWELISPLVQLSTLSLVVKSKGLTKSWKTCSDLVLSHSERIGRNLFHSLNLLITIVSNLV